MAGKERPAWPGRDLRRPRHGPDEGSGRVNWTAIALVVAVLLGVGAAVYAGFQIGDDKRPPADFARPPRVVVDDPDAVTSPSSSVSGPTEATITPPPRGTTTTRPPVETTTTTRAPKAGAAFEQGVIASTAVLTTGRSFSTNRLRLTVTAGGNLVLQDQGRTVWQTGTTTGVKLVMQNDGHLVLYDARNANVWSSGTDGNPGAVLILRSDGNMVVALDDRVLFETGTGD